MRAKRLTSGTLPPMRYWQIKAGSPRAAREAARRAAAVEVAVGVLDTGRPQAAVQARTAVVSLEVALRRMQIPDSALEEVAVASRAALLEHVARPEFRSSLFQHLGAEGDSRTDSLTVIAFLDDWPSSQVSVLCMAADLVSPSTCDVPGQHRVLLVPGAAAPRALEWVLGAALPGEEPLVEVTPVSLEATAETVAVLWAPRDSNSPFRDFCQAFKAARKLSGEESVATGDLASWKSKFALETS